MVDGQIAEPRDGRKRITDERVLAAMRVVPRHVFIPEDLRRRAYTDGPLPIGHGQTISQPYIVALMTELLELGPDDRVLEIGTGLGTYSMFAAEAGAQKVWAVEGGPIVSVAQAIARLNGYADKIEFVRGWFPTLDVPTGLDVVIFEDYPPRLIDDWTHGVLRHVHERVLKSGGRMIPERARLCLAPVHAADYLHMVGSIADAGERAYGIDWTSESGTTPGTPSRRPGISRN